MFLFSKVAVLEAERPRAASLALQAPVSEVQDLPNGVKALAPPSVHGVSGGDMVKVFVDALDTNFELVGLKDSVYKTGFASVFFESKLCTWFTLQGYFFDENRDALERIELSEMLLMMFYPADFERMAREILQAVKYSGPDVFWYIAAFNEAINR